MQRVCGPDKAVLSHTRYFLNDPRGSQQMQAVQVSDEEERIVRLFMDPLVHHVSLGPNRVFCIACGTRVALSGRFDATKWDEHVKRCAKARNATIDLARGRRVVWAEFFEGLNIEDSIFDREEKKMRTGIYSERAPLLVEIARQESMKLSMALSPYTSSTLPARTPFRESGSHRVSGNESQHERKSFFETLQLPPLPQRPPLDGRSSSSLVMLTNVADQQDYLSASE
ncbi:hypothetical protein AAF712_006304 [Marasmius tenuissimus]|uniref:Uncharacterized protein n=1 Tax=Marasmius tenuissimus TaxID=585030 RepID=A0ABR3A0Y9_9AGAR